MDGFCFKIFLKKGSGCNIFGKHTPGAGFGSALRAQRGVVAKYVVDIHFVSKHVEKRPIHMFERPHNQHVQRTIVL